MINRHGVKTYSNEPALNALATLAGLVTPGRVIVEIGVFRGGSLAEMARHTGQDVYGIDTWGLEGAYASGSEDPSKYGIENMRLAQKATEGLDNVHLIRGFSTEVARSWPATRPVELLYIDGEHTYEACWSDFRAWSQFLVADAFVAFDDYRPSHPGVMQAVDEIAQEYFWGRKVTVHGGRLAVGRVR